MQPLLSVVPHHSLLKVATKQALSGVTIRSVELGGVEEVAQRGCPVLDCLALQSEPPGGR